MRRPILMDEVVLVWQGRNLSKVKLMRNLLGIFMLLVTLLINLTYVTSSAPTLKQCAQLFNVYELSRFEV